MLAFVFGAVVSFAQVLMPQEALKLDSTVVYGKLDNGFTYYIKHHEKPEKRADFYLVTDAGAIQETPAQDGLAHFLEHMCLNGTKNFPGNGIISYMESIGAKFGENINAGTGVEQTYYMLNNIPVIREGIIDSSLLILHDYSAYVTCDPKDIDDERGVILEEKRVRNTASWRERDAAFAAIFKGSKYATCSLIGSEENLKTFEPEELVSFYKTWYRPDMQAILVVGDVDVERTEAKIKEIFSSIPKVENPKQKEVIKVPNNNEPIVLIFTDKENTRTSLDIIYKSEPLPKEFRGLGMAVIYDLSKTLISSILNERYKDIYTKPDAPFTGASAGFQSLCTTLDGFAASTSAKDGEIIPAFKALLTELYRAQKFGFTQSEFDRAKANILKGYERAAEEESTRMNGSIVFDYANHFLSNVPYTSASYMNDVVKSYFDAGFVNLEMINQIMASLLTENNVVILYSAPEKDGLVHPKEGDLLAVLNAVKSEDLKPLEGDVAMEPLMDASSLKGAGIAAVSEEKFGATKYVLDNGIEVFVKPTDFKKDAVSIKSVIPGGKSLLPDDLLLSADAGVIRNFDYFSGISKFPSATLAKMLTGKSVSILPYVSNDRHGFSGVASPKDLETLMQLFYLSYADPRIEDEELNVPLEQMKTILENYKGNPSFIFSSLLNKSIAENENRSPFLDNNTIAGVTVEKYRDFYRQLFSDAKGMQIYIVGNVDMENLEPLMEKYFGSLPVSAENAPVVDKGQISLFKKGENVKDLAIDMVTPMTYIAIAYNVPMERSLKEAILCRAASHILDMLYTKTIREDEGGTYGVSAYADLSPVRNEALLMISFNTEPVKAEKLIGIAYDGLKGIAENGPDGEDLIKARESLIKQYPENIIDNGYWMTILEDYFHDGFDGDTDFVKVVNETVTSDNIRELVRKFLESGNHMEIVVNPEE